MDAPPPQARSTDRDELTARIDGFARAASAGDRQAREDLMAALHGPVLRYCRGRLRNPVDANTAEDIAQDTLIGVLKALPTFDHGGSSPFLAFAFRIARNKIVDTVRRGHISRIDLVDDVPETSDVVDRPDDLAVRAERAEMVLKLLGRLPERHREVLRLRVVVGLTAVQTAEILGSTPGSVRVTQHRALVALRRYLENRPVPGEQVREGAAV
ncbi:MAG: sigma-70 family RNA polymerase sigma factor [Pseudonocardia sp.]|nr:sigma-70 family RNA polymerase sigma factor [Pseudonocardia sp.]